MYQADMKAWVPLVNTSMSLAGFPLKCGLFSTEVVLHETQNSEIAFRIVPFLWSMQQNPTEGSNEWSNDRLMQ